MDAVEFVKERNRMCSTYTPKRCEGCPADNYGKEGTACIMVDKIDAERLVPIVEKWAATHPCNTRQSVFLEQWPNALTRYDDGLPQANPCELDTITYNFGNCNRLSCTDCRHKFWMHEVE